MGCVLTGLPAKAQVDPCDIESEEPMGNRHGALCIELWRIVFHHATYRLTCLEVRSRLEASFSLQQYCVTPQSASLRVGASEVGV